MRNSAAHTRHPSGSDTLFVNSVEKGFCILDAFRQGQEKLGLRDLSLTEISKLTGLDKSAVQRFTNTFVILGYLDKDPYSRRYSPANRLVDFFYTYLISSRKARPQAKYTTPITAAFAAFKAFGAKNIGVLTPYRADVNSMVKAYIEKAGFSVPVFGSFNEEDDPTAARISLASIKAAALEIGGHEDVDAVFVSCTSLRLTSIAADIENALNKPVTSSNHAMAWHCLRLAGIDDKLPKFGRLFSLGL